MTSRITRLAGTIAAAATIGSITIIAPTTAMAAPAPAATTSVATAAASATTGAATRERSPKASRSMTGVRASAYVGGYYSPRYERTRQCIVRKESGGNYRITSRSGTYKGAYQFNSALARSTALRMGRRDLANRPMNTWSRFDQDKAFWMVWNHGRGARNWPTRYGC